MKNLIVSITKPVITILFIMLLFTGCKKFLDEKQDNKFTIPQTLADLQMLLDNYTAMNTGYPYQTEVAADNFYLTSTDFNALSDNTQKNFHTWQKEDLRLADWAQMYKLVLNANTVLEYVDELTFSSADIELAKKLKAAALFYRANAFYTLAQVYAYPYDENTDAPYGIPLRLSTDINSISFRASVSETYNRIISDLKEAAVGLDTIRPYPNRPTKTAAYAALARCYLSMGNYINAGFYADSALQINNNLINFNTLSTTAANPFTRFNKEVIFPAISSTANCLAPARAKVDTLLFRSFHANDLRRVLFFKLNSNGSAAFKGDYNAANNGSVFMGYTTSELYLIKAEALARQNMVQPAMSTLNALLVTRWRNNSFIPFTASGQQEALNIILNERRKELCFRGQRWTDLRRLNKDATTQVTLSRIFSSTSFTLLPGSSAYIFQIPAGVIEQSGIQQNP